MSARSLRSRKTPATNRKAAETASPPPRGTGNDVHASRLGLVHDLVAQDDRRITGVSPSAMAAAAAKTTMMGRIASPVVEMKVIRKR
jgi:hypothetical protein